jgi:hypothetical protein
MSILNKANKISKLLQRVLNRQSVKLKDGFIRLGNDYDCWLYLNCENNEAWC